MGSDRTQQCAGPFYDRVINDGLVEKVTFKLGLKDEKDLVRQKTANHAISTQGGRGFTRRTPSKWRVAVFFLFVQDVDFARNCERSANFIAHHITVL